MKSKPTGPGESIIASQYNSSRDDSRASGFLLPHQQLGALALPTNPTNGQTVTLTINPFGFHVITYVTALGSVANSVLIQSTAALTAAATVNFLRRPDITNANQIAAHAPDQALLQYVGWSLPPGGTTLTPFSLNKNVNGTSAPLTSFTIATSVTGASWTPQTMQLYVEDGVYYIGTTRVVFAGASTPTVTAPVSNPRIDVLSINSSGTLSWTTGTESASPVAPAYPTGVIVICELYNVVGETGLYDNENQQSGEGYIYNDIRPLLGGTYISSASQVASGLFILDPGSEAQGDVLYYTGSVWQRLPAGTSGTFLQTLGASANPQWAPVSVGEKDGTQANQSLTATTSLQTTNLTVTHTLGRTPTLIHLSCQIITASSPSSGDLTTQLFMTYDASGNAVAGMFTTYLPNNGTIAGLGGPANPLSVASGGGTDAVTISVGVTSIGSTTFTIQIKWQLTTGTGSFGGSSVNNINWAVIG